MHIFSSGFGVVETADNSIIDSGSVKRLTCGTEKGRHRCKNDRTAGIYS